MTQAILTLHGIPALRGTVETGGDYVQFRTDAAVDRDQLARLSEGEITIDGKPEKVMIKSVHPYHPAPEDAEAQGERLELTLQRFTPSAR